MYTARSDGRTGRRKAGSMIVGGTMEEDGARLRCLKLVKLWLRGGMICVADGATNVDNTHIPPGGFALFALAHTPICRLWTVVFDPDNSTENSRQSVTRDLCHASFGVSRKFLCVCACIRCVGSYQISEKDVRSDFLRRSHRGLEYPDWYAARKTGRSTT